jgi:hypothetical protein
VVLISILHQDPTLGSPAGMWSINLPAWGSLKNTVIEIFLEIWGIHCFLATL